MSKGPIQTMLGLPTYGIETLRLFGMSQQPTLENSEPGFPLAYTCSLCRALVHVTSLQSHADWHEKLRRAVDETEILG